MSSMTFFTLNSNDEFTGGHEVIFAGFTGEIMGYFFIVFSVNFF